jgi:hypothetical protein
VTHYLIDTIVVKLEQKTRAKAAVPIGKNPETGKTIYEIEREDIGWFVLLQHIHEWLFLGFQEPDLEVGQQVTIRIEPK